MVPRRDRRTGQSQVPAPEVKYTIEHSGAKLGIVSTELAEVARAGAPDITWLETEPSAPGSFDVELDAATEAEPGDFTDEQVAQVLYTSGTTSSPKGCVHSHRNIFQVGTLINLNMDYRDDDRYLICMPIWHSAPLNIALIPTIQMGGTVVLQRAYHPVDSMQIIATEEITTFFGPTVAYVAPIMTAKKLGFDFGDYDFSSIRRWNYGGAPIDRATAAMLIDAYGTNQFYNLFGMSEMGPTGCLLGPEDQLRKAGSIGRHAMVGNAMRVVTADGAEAGPGETGEIWFAGDTRMREYLGNPQATEAAFEGEWYKTGDLARIDEDGYLYIVDRSKDVIIVGGENVFSSRSRRPSSPTSGSPMSRWWRSRIRSGASRSSPSSRPPMVWTSASTSCATTWPTSSPDTNCRAKSLSLTSCRATRRASCSSTNCAARWLPTDDGSQHAENCSRPGRPPNSRSGPPHLGRTCGGLES